MTFILDGTTCGKMAGSCESRCRPQDGRHYCDCIQDLVFSSTKNDCILWVDDNDDDLASTIRPCVLLMLSAIVAGIAMMRWIDSEMAFHCSDVIMSAMASQITGVSIVWLTVCTCTYQRKYQRSASLALCEGNPPVTSGFPSQRASNTEMFPFDDVIMYICIDVD